MNLIPIVILWSISVLHPGPTDYVSTPRTELESASRDNESLAQSHLSMRQTDAFSPRTPGYCDPGAIQGEDDDNFDGGAFRFSSFPHWASGTQADASTHFQPRRRTGCSFDRTLPYRC
jgi:hypothetical protein